MVFFRVVFVPSDFFNSLVVTVGDGTGRARIGEELAGPLGRGANGDAGDREAHPSRIPASLAVAAEITDVGQHDHGMAVGGRVGQSAVDAKLRPVWSCRQSTSGRAVRLDHQRPDDRRDERGDQQQRGDGGEDVLLARHLPIRPALCGVDNPWPRWWLQLGSSVGNDVGSRP